MRHRCGAYPDSRPKSQSHAGADRRGRTRALREPGIRGDDDRSDRDCRRRRPAHDLSSFRDEGGDPLRPPRRPARRRRRAPAGTSAGRAGAREPPRGSARALRAGLRPPSTGADQGRARNEPGASQDRSSPSASRSRQNLTAAIQKSTRRAVVTARDLRADAHGAQLVRPRLLGSISSENRRSLVKCFDEIVAGCLAVGRR